MKIFVYSARPYELPFLERAAEGKHELVFSDKRLSLDTAGLASGCDAVSIFTSDDASAPVIQKLNAYSVKFLALRCAGYDHVDLVRASKLQIQVANVPAYSPHSVAEHAVALLMALNRKIVEGQMLMHMHDFRLDPLVGFDVHGKTVGIIGTGTIGMTFAKIMHGFGARLIGCDPVQNPAADSLGLKYVSFDELLKQSDIISLHCPLNPNTHHMFTEKQFVLMRNRSIIINTARGGVIKTEALLDALEKGVIGGACLDVYEYEKPIFFNDRRNCQLADPLFSRLQANRNVIVSGHQGFLTREALGGIAETTIKNLDYWEDGEKAPCQLNEIEQIAEVNKLPTSR